MKRSKMVLAVVVVFVLCVAGIALRVMNNHNNSMKEQQEVVTEEMVVSTVQDESADVCVMQLETEKEYTLPGKENIHTIYISEREGMDYGESSVMIQTDVSEDTIQIASVYVNDAYLINNQNNRCFLLLSVDICSDDFVLYVYEIVNGELKEPQQISDVVINDKSVIDIPRMKLACQMDVLGSYIGYAEYSIDENGMVYLVDEMYEIPVDENNIMQILTVKQEIPVMINGQEKLLPVGTGIRIIGTDNKGTARFRIEGSNKEGEIFYTEGDGVNTWGCCINGIQDYEYFEFVPYAG